MTSLCEIDHDDDVHSPPINPSTPAGRSPGLLGDEGLGALAPLGLDGLL